MANKTSSDKVTSAQRRAQAVEYRKAGLNYQQIGDQMGITPQAAHKLVSKALREFIDKTQDGLDEMRTLELQRLDRALMAIYPKVQSGQVLAIDRMIKIMDRRAKLMGLDAPAKLAPTDPTGEQPYEVPKTDAELAERINAILDAARARRADQAGGDSDEPNE